MLTFLRKIRKSLIESGSGRKYLLYAIGEIALVVIGILIALQINNRNEWKKDREKERLLLMELSTSLKDNSRNLRFNVKDTTKFRSISILLSVIENQELYNDSLDYHIGKISLQLESVLLPFNSGVYESFLYNGLDLIEKPNLKSEIVELFGDTYPFRKNVIQTINEDNRLLREYLRKNFKKYNYDSCFDNYVPRLKPLSASTILANNYFQSLLFDANRRLITQRSMYKGLLSKTEQVLALIEDELGEVEI